MNRNFEELCFLIVCRQEANLKRKRLLYHLNKQFNPYRNNRSRGIHIYQHGPNFERSEYRSHADKMKKTAKDIYSPLRRKLKVSIKYDTNNQCVSAEYDDCSFNFKRIKEIAVGYQFDNIVLRDGLSPINPYIE